MQGRGGVDGGSSRKQHRGLFEQDGLLAVEEEGGQEQAAARLAVQPEGVGLLQLGGRGGLAEALQEGEGVGGDPVAGVGVIELQGVPGQFRADGFAEVMVCGNSRLQRHFGTEARDQSLLFGTDAWLRLRAGRRSGGHRAVIGCGCHLSVEKARSVRMHVMVTAGRKKAKELKGENSLFSVIWYRPQVRRGNVLWHSCGYHTESLSLS